MWLDNAENWFRRYGNETGSAAPARAWGGWPRSPASAPTASRGSSRRPPGRRGTSTSSRRVEPQIYLDHLELLRQLGLAPRRSGYLGLRVGEVLPGVGNR